MIEATDLDTGQRKPVVCPDCRAELVIDADRADIGWLACTANETHLWLLHTAMNLQPVDE